MSAARRSDSDADRAALEAALGKVKPLPADPRAAPPAPRRRSGTGAPAPAAPTPLCVEETGERLEGIAAGVDRAHLRRLKRGAVPVDLRVDLHGLDAREAERVLGDVLRRALASGARCLLVVHGRGLHSKSAPVLRALVRDWLREVAGSVLAFASARPEHGGPGATYVLLRRQARRRRARSEP